MQFRKSVFSGYTFTFAFMENLFIVYQKAVKLLELGRPAAARKELLQLLTAEPKFAPALSTMALCFFEEKDFKKAAEYARAALEQSPNESEFHFVLGMVQTGLEEWEAAINSIETAVALNPNNAEYFVQLSLLYLQLKIYGKARQNLEKALAIDPGHEVALGLRSHYENLLGRDQSARQYMDKAIGANPENTALHWEMGDQAFNKGDYGQAAFHYQLVLQKQPGEWQLRERFLDARLGLHAVYKWLAIKYRPFFTVSYATLIFDIFLVILGAIMLKERDTGESYFMYLKWLTVLLAIKSFIFWFLRTIGHIWMRHKIWKLHWVEHLNYSTYLQLSALMAITSFLFYLVSKDFLWLGTAMVLLILALVSMVHLLLEDTKKKKFFRFYLYFIYSVGATTFITELVVPGGVQQLVDLLVFSIFGPVVLAIVWETVRDAINKKTVPIKSLEKRSVSMKIKILDWVVVPIGLGVFGVGGFYGTNIVSVLAFGIIWGGIGVATAALLFYYLKKKQSPLLNLESNFETTDDRTTRVFRILLSVFFWVLLSGICITAFSGLGKTTQERAAIVKHGNNEKKERAYVWVMYRGKTVKLRPDRITWEAAIHADSVLLTVRKSLFAVEYVDNISVIEKE